MAARYPLSVRFAPIVLDLALPCADHGVSRSLYTADPDGNEIELYCDAPREEWEGRVDSVMTVRPLSLD